MKTELSPQVTTEGVTPFHFNDHLVRVLLRDGEPWWVAKDVAEILGYDKTCRAVRLLAEDEKEAHKVGTLGGDQNCIHVNEAGLYRLIFNSRQEEAETFRRWVLHDVLPAIRKTGGYHIKQPLMVEQARLFLEMAEHQAKQDRELSSTKRIAQAALDKAESNFGMYSVLAFARLNNLDMTLKEAARHGSKLANICRSLGQKVGNLKDPRFGRVNTYPESTLADYFQAQGLTQETTYA